MKRAGDSGKSIERKREKGQEGRCRLPAIALAAVLTWIGLMALVRIPILPGSPHRSTVVSERAGVYDLTALGDLDNVLVTLPPGETFYPNEYVVPEHADDAAPTDITLYGQERTDYLTQRFRIALPDDHAVYALTFQVSGRHAMRAYVNGALAAQAGTPGASREETEVWENRLVCYAAPQNGRLDVLLHCAQFYHYRYKNGARLAALVLQKSPPGPDTEGLEPRKGLLVTGALLCAALLLFCIFLLQPATRATLYFSLACLAMTLREYTQSQAWTYFSFPSGRVSFALEYLSVVLLTIFLSLYLGQFPIGRFLKYVQRTALTGAGMFGLLILWGDTMLYTRVLAYYQMLLVLCISVGVTGLFWTLRRPNREQASALYGIAVFYIAAVSDLLMYNHLLKPWLSKVPVSEASMLIFVLAQTVSLFQANNRLVAQAREAERRIAGEKEVLSKLNRMKTEFLGNVSHELKTPLTVVSSHIQYIRSALPPQPELEEARRTMQLIEGETARMGLMVSQLLDISRIDEGRMSMDKKRESLVEIIQSAMDHYYPYFSKNHNKLLLKRDGEIPPVVCDRVRVTQVLVNLITNASRHTRQGEICVWLRQEGQSAAVTVSDTGEGISPERIPHLFERYYSSAGKEEKAASGWDTGTGLGLYICKYIVNAHGGSICVKSSPGAGTRVRFTLPLAE